MQSGNGWWWKLEKHRFLQLKIFFCKRKSFVKTNANPNRQFPKRSTIFWWLFHKVGSVVLSLYSCSLLGARKVTVVSVSSCLIGCWFSGALNRTMVSVFSWFINCWLFGAWNTAVVSVYTWLLDCPLFGAWSTTVVVVHELKFTFSLLFPPLLGSRILKKVQTQFSTGK